MAVERLYAPYTRPALNYLRCSITHTQWPTDSACSPVSVKILFRTCPLQALIVPSTTIQQTSVSACRWPHGAVVENDQTHLSSVKWSPFSVIEVCSKEYGDYSEKMAMAVENGKCLRWYKENSETRKPIVRRASQYDLVSNHLYDFSSTGWHQFNVLLRRMMLQHRRNSVSVPVEGRRKARDIVVHNVFFKF